MAKFILEVEEGRTECNLDEMGKVDPLATEVLFLSKIIAELESCKLSVIKKLDKLLTR